jgi:AraC-like DNA-binding protein
MSSADSYPKQYLYRRVVRAKLFIDAHFSSAIDLDNIADEACFSKFHFTRLFKMIYGKTPHQYLTDVRINAGKELLAANNPVARVCYSVGFDSISSFTGLFRRRVGMTPAAFQHAALARLTETMDKPLKFVPNCFIESVQNSLLLSSQLD